MTTGGRTPSGGARRGTPRAGAPAVRRATPARPRRASRSTGAARSSSPSQVRRPKANPKTRTPPARPGAPGAGSRTRTKDAPPPTRPGAVGRPKAPTAERAGAATSGRRRRSHGRMLGALLVSVLLVAFLLVGVFPTRTFLAQRASTNDAARQVAALRARNKALGTQIDRLQTPEEIERIARQEYGMVRPGEEAYAILPTPPPPIELPEVWPFVGVAGALNR